ncbi:hypothetical protein CC78DRAFT_546628 [Lojkania enalia]|uniref:Uncharacterized protein n=1 Tax=Lojkania enalia TaxID=147567 RepID=A0A9P4N0J4_9PLEO|nr:hypothetical protein CC78DRAFT_546628 [Didymosphaeria enalia]
MGLKYTKIFHQLIRNQKRALRLFRHLPSSHWHKLRKMGLSPNGDKHLVPGAWCDAFDNFPSENANGVAGKDKPPSWENNTKTRFLYGTPWTLLNGDEVGHQLVKGHQVMRENARLQLEKFLCEVPGNGKEIEAWCQRRHDESEDTKVLSKSIEYSKVG